MNKNKAKKMGKDIGYWIAQAKSLTFSELEGNVEVPLNHWCGDHSNCGDWCYSKKAEKEGKCDNKKPLFDVCDEADKISIEKVREIQEEFTTRKKLVQMHHPHATQLNESINMRIAEVAPKHKNFSRTGSLGYRISHVIGCHNDGSSYFFHRVLELLRITPSIVLAEWAKRKDQLRQSKILRDCTPKNKRKRAHKQEAREKHEIYLERTKTIKDGSYKSGVSCNPDAPTSKGKKKWKRKPCLCGMGVEHFSSRYQLCKCNKNNQQKQPNK